MINNYRIQHKKIIVTPEFKEYSALLEIDFSIDYWSDLAIDEAIDHLEKFDENDWIELKKNLHRKSCIWQTRCAETLSEVPLKK